MGAGRNPSGEAGTPTGPLTTKLAAVTRPHEGGVPGAEELLLTSLLPCSPKLMINVETGDAAVVTKRSCGCPLGEAALDTHFQGIRSYEKMTGEGTTFLGAELEDLLEDVLPAEFGGAPTDYQFVEESEGPLVRLTLVASPRLGELDEERAVSSVLDRLGRGTAGHRMMAGALRDAEFPATEAPATADA